MIGNNGTQLLDKDRMREKKKKNRRTEVHDLRCSQSLKRKGEDITPVRQKGMNVTGGAYILLTGLWVNSMQGYDLAGMEEKGNTLEWEEKNLGTAVHDWN